MVWTTPYHLDPARSAGLYAILLRILDPWYPKGVLEYMYPLPPGQDRRAGHQSLLAALEETSECHVRGSIAFANKPDVFFFNGKKTRNWWAGNL